MTADHLAAALAAGCALALVATPIARRLALATGFLDRPGLHKSHGRSTPYLGGVAIAVAAVAGTAIGAGIHAQTGRILTIAFALGLVGLLDDRLVLPALPRLGAQVAAALLLWVGGIHLGLSGSSLVDGVFSVIWLVGVTNAFNLLDNMDGLCAGTAALAGLGLVGVALTSGQVALAIAAVAISGACLGFLPFNLMGASVFMGDAGSMFLGTTIAALSLAVRPPGSTPLRAVVLVLIVSLPLLDIVTVTTARARRGISVAQGGRDHLSHRLVAIGLGRTFAVVTLLLTEVFSVVVAVMVSRGLIRPPVGLAVAALPLAAIWVWSSRVPVYSQPVVGLPATVRWTVLGGGVLLVAISAPAVLAMIEASHAIKAGTAAAEAGIAQEQAGDTTAATQDFRTAEVSFAVARRRLSGLAVGATMYVPVISDNLRAARSLVDVGLGVSRIGQTLTADADVGSLRIEGGQVSLEALNRLAPRLRAVSNQLATLATQIHGVDRSLLVPQLRRGVASMDTKLAIANRQARQIADATDIVPALLGASGPRRYFLAIENNAEARATGGFIGNFGELLAQSGHIAPGRFDRIGALNSPAGVHRSVPAPRDYRERYGKFLPFDNWQNINLSPDFPTVAAVIAALYPGAGGDPVDGVIGVDPVALSDILLLTGPIHVPAWPTAITADNVVQVTLQGAYDAFPNEQRVGFLGEISQAVFQALTSRDLGSPIHVALLLGPAVQQQHLQLFLTRTNEEAFASRLGAAGALTPSSGDQLLLTTQNGSGNKVDYYLRRSVNYMVSIDPLGDPQNRMMADVRSTLRVDLNNTAPNSGHSSFALGPYDVGFEAGENRSFVSVYTPLAVGTGSVDGRSVPLQSGTERGLHVYSTYVDIPASTTRTLTFTMAGTLPLAAGGWYTLQMPRQPVLNLDHVSVQVAVPPGWQVQTGDAGSPWSQQLTIVRDVETSSTIRVRIRRTGPMSWLAPLPAAFPPTPP